MTLTGIDIINALKDLESPGNITEIVAHLRSKNKGSETTLTEAAKVLLEAGVRFGQIVQEENKFRCTEPIKENETETDKINKSVQTVVDNNKETSSSNGRKEKSENKSKRTTKKVEHKHFSSEDNDETEDDLNDAADCYGPSSRRRRSRSRSRRRSRRSKRLSSRLKRRYRM